MQNLAMNPNPRQIKLLKVVQALGSVTVEQLADQLGVTLQTVRRDVQRLADEGLLTRFHGGVRVPGSTVENMAYPQREIFNVEGKARIARAVAAERARGCAVVMSTHDIDDAETADLVLLLAGRIVAAGTPEQVLTPENLRASFGGTGVH